LKGYKQEKIWDPVTRLWHWVLVVAISAGWSFGKFMSFDTIQWHFYIGYFVLGLMVFRYLWGFVGPQPIRYRALIPGFSETIQYLRNIGKRKPSGSAGHNPVGSLSVIAMVLIITAQASSGLFVESDDFFESGPMVQYVSEATVAQMTWWHRFIADIVLILVVTHVAAILFYLLWKKENLIKPMFTGWKWVKKE
jgi:cytochrome b